MNLILYLLLALLLALQLGDALTTRRALPYGGVESNPAIAFLIRNLGFWPAMILKVGFVMGCALLCLLESRLWASLTLAVLCSFYVWVVAHNWRLVK